MEEILNLLPNNTNMIMTVLVIASIFIEITPIKINPLSSIVKWIGNCINKDTLEKLSSISLQLDSVSNRIDKIEINDMRSTILEFANSCMNERKHTKEEFEHIIDLYTSYEKIIQERGMRNGRIDLAYQYISDLYTTCLKEKSFLDS